MYFLDLFDRRRSSRHSRTRLLHTKPNDWCKHNSSHCACRMCLNCTYLKPLSLLSKCLYLMLLVTQFSWLGVLSESLMGQERARILPEEHGGRLLGGWRGQRAHSSLAARRAARARAFFPSSAAGSARACFPSSTAGGPRAFFLSCTAGGARACFPSSTAGGARAFFHSSTAGGCIAVGGSRG